MTIQDLGALGELIGSVAVLATLIYLTLQTRQNTRATRAQLEAASVAATTSTLRSCATSPDYAEALRQDGGYVSSDLSTGQMQLSLMWEAMLRQFAWEFHQIQRGLLAPEVSGMTSTIQMSFTQSQLFPGWWEGRKHAFPTAFVEWVEEQRAKAA